MILRRLLRSRSGVAMTEFALAAPFVLTFGLWGIEISNYALVNMKISQVTSHIADNASRIGDLSTLDQRKIYESDIVDLLVGANIQAGTSLKLLEHGRIIVSSVEIYNGAIHCKNENNCNKGTISNGEPFINWQRCKGQLTLASAYGSEKNKDKVKFGIGPEDEELMPVDGMPVIFVEVSYDYQPLFSNLFVSASRINSISGFVVRDSRDQSGIYDASGSDPVADCKVYDSQT